MVNERIKMLFRHYKRVFNNETPPPAGTTPPAGTPPPPPSPEAKFTQADLDRHIGERLAKENKKHQEEKEKLLADVQKLNLTSQQKQELEAKLEEIRVKSLSDKELVEERAKKSQKEWEAKLKDAEDAKNKAFTTYATEKMHRDLMDAAVANEAYSPEQLVDMLQNKSRITEELDSDNKPTGNYVTKVKLTLVKDKKSQVVELEPKDAVKVMKDNPEKFGNLFKSGVLGGLGANVGSRTSGQQASLEDMPMDEFYKGYRTDRTKVGLNRKG